MESTENQMPSQCRTNGNVGGFKIANFSDHDDVRILPNDMPQTGRER